MDIGTRVSGGRVQPAAAGGHYSGLGRTNFGSSSSLLAKRTCIKSTRENSKRSSGTWRKQLASKLVARSGNERDFFYKVTAESVDRMAAAYDELIKDLVWRTPVRTTKGVAGGRWRASLEAARSEEDDNRKEETDKLRHLKPIQNEAKTKLDAMAMPHKKDEPFRFLSMRKLYMPRFSSCRGPVSRGVIDFAAQRETKGRTAVFVDGTFDNQLSDNLPEDLRASGCYVGGMDDLPADLLPRVLAEIKEVPIDKYGSEWFATLTQRMMNDVAVVYLAENAQIEQPIQLTFYTSPPPAASSTSDVSLLDKATTSFPRIVVLADKNSKAQLLFTHTGDPDTVYHSNPTTTIKVSEEADLDMFYHQDQSTKATHIETLNVTLKGDSSSYKWSGLTNGAVIGRINVAIDLKGDDATLELNSASIATSGSQQDVHAFVAHHGLRGSSQQEHRMIIGSKATGIFRGQMKVYKEAEFVDCDQQSRALLLHPTGTAVSMPTLAVTPDKIEGAAHGSAISDLAGEDLYYLKTRGISEAEGKAMLIKGFFRHIVQRFPFDMFRARILEKVVTIAEEATFQYRQDNIEGDNLAGMMQQTDGDLDQFL